MWNMNMAQKSQLYNVVLRKVSALPPFPLLSQATKCISFWLISSVLLFFCSYISIILEKAMAPHSSTLAWKIPWTEKPGGLQSMESLRVGHDWATSLSLFTFHFSLSCIGEGNGNPLQCSCLENPKDGGAWWTSVSGVAQSRTWLKRLSSSSSSKYHIYSYYPFSLIQNCHYVYNYICNYIYTYMFIYIAIYICVCLTFFT